MRRIGHSSLAFLAALALVVSIATSVSAAPPPNSIRVVERIYNDCPLSTVTTVNNYPASLSITDSWNGLCVGFANLHAWTFSGDGGATSLNLGNAGNYKFKATVTLTGTGTVEGGIQLAPWWSATDGRFQARIPDGEVACFGGRLPFYSFTASNGVVYVAGTPITLEIEYQAHALTGADPAKIQYRLTYGSNSYSSPLLPFDQGNPSENPPHGLWGALNPAHAGGVVQVNNGSGGSGYNATWTNIEYSNLADGPGLGTWGLVVCVVVLLGMGSAVLVNRRRSLAA
jgi:hypothetical protein